MKLLTVVLSAIVLVSLLAPNIGFTEPTHQSEIGLVACWGGDGNANDAVGQNHGIPQNGATYAPGLFGMAFSLDGIDDFILVPESDDLDFPAGSSVSIVAWGLRTAGGTQHLLGKRVGCGSTTGIAYQLAIGGGAIPDGDAPLNTWLMFAITTDSATGIHRSYVNDQIVHEATWVIQVNDADVRIGNSGTCQPFAGLLDEVRIYNRALTPEDISSLYQATIPCNEVTGTPHASDGHPHLALKQNVPNPFNPITVIRYDLPEAAQVNLRIYDIAGRLVRALVKGEMVEAGSKEIVWNGCDGSGHQVTSGVYFYRLDYDDYSEVKRMVLLK